MTDMKKYIIPRFPNWKIQTSFYLPDWIVYCMALGRPGSQRPSDQCSAKDIILTQVRGKFGCWSSLPYRICGMASSNEEQARSCARACLRLYEESTVSPAAGREVATAHAITRLFLEPDPRLASCSSIFFGHLCSAGSICHA